jgi:colicin import membrane protein
MNESTSYRKSFYLAIGLHVFLAIVLMFESETHNPVLNNEITQQQNMLPTPTKTASQEVVKAVSVENNELSEAVNRLKLQREKQHQQEVARQNELTRLANLAKQTRLKEQQQLAKLKKETEQLAIARKKQMEEEKRHLKELAEQKEKETKRLADLKKKQEVLKQQQAKEAERVEKIQKQQAMEAIKEEKAKAEKAALALENQRKAAIAEAHANAEQAASMAGEINKYKALILNAISEKWIFPDNVDPTLSSKFRIRLAPDGMVLEVSLIKSSGDPILDRSAQTAIYKASPLPVPHDPATFNQFRDINLTVRPTQLRG